MPVFTLYTLEAANVSIVDPTDPSAAPVLSGFDQGSGVHLDGMEITLNSNAWQTVDVFDDDNNFNDSESGQNLDSDITYGSATYDAGSRVEAEYRLTVVDPSGNTYTLIGFNINSSDGSPSYGTVEGLAFIGPVSGFPPIGVTLTVVDTAEGPGGATTPYASYATPPCFTPGTQIETDRGLKNVEDLIVGDLVRTKDDGFQPVRWIGHRNLTWSDLWARPKLRPVVIAADAIGEGMPRTAMHVSPMHRVVFDSPLAELLFEENEVLIPAGHLVNSKSVTRDTDLKSVTYIHIAFDRHQLVLSDGLWTESYLPGAQTLNGMDVATQEELEELFPGVLNGKTEPVAARRSLRRHEAQVLLAA